jgi:hypothetical protein
MAAMRRAATLAVVLGITTATATAIADTPIPRPPDSDAPAGAAPHWLPPDHWIHHHYTPFDEARLYALLHVDRAGLWSWLRDDTQTIAQLAATKGWPDPRKLAAALVAPRAKDVGQEMLAELRSRTYRILVQGHLSQHVIFHSLHQESGPAAAPRLFGVASSSAFQRLRRLDISPLQIGRAHGRTRASMQRGLEAVLREAVHHGVHEGDMSERQAETLLRRQLRQVPRWLGEEHYNGPPQTVGGKPRFPFRPSFASPVLSGDGSRVLFDAAQPAPPLAVRFGEVNLEGFDVAAGARLTPRDASPFAQADRPCSSFNASLSRDGHVAAYELSAGNRTFAKRYGNVVIAVADLRARTLRTVAGKRPGASTETDYAPSLSGDGGVVAYQSVAADPMSMTSDTATRVVVRSLRTGRTVKVPRAGAYEAELSGDGRTVAFTAIVRRRSQVFVMDVATRRVSQISRAGGEAWAPSLSDDGTRVAYAASETSGGRSRILLSDRRSGRTTALSAAGASLADQPSLSGDGRVVAYQQQLLGRRPDHTGRPIQRVVVRTVGGRAHTITPGRQWAGQPQLSDDGRTVAYTTDAQTAPAGPGGLRVMVHRLDGASAATPVSPLVPLGSFDGGTGSLQATRSACDLRPPAW